MSPIIHGMIAWIIALAIAKKVQDRRLIVVAGVIPDIDGIFILWNSDLFYTYHHTFGHSFILAVPLAFLAAKLGSDKRKVFFGCILAFSFHLIADFLGATLPLYPFYPIHDLIITPLDHFSYEIIHDVINPAASAFVMLVIILIMIKWERSPLEFISEKLDNRFVGLYIFPFKYRCSACGGRPSIRCSVCNNYTCTDHIGSYRKWQCKKCIHLSKIT